MPLLNLQTTRLPLEAQLSNPPLPEAPDIPEALKDRLLHRCTSSPSHNPVRRYCRDYHMGVNPSKPDVLAQIIHVLTDFFNVRPGHDVDFNNALRVYVEMLDNYENKQRILTEKEKTKFEQGQELKRKREDQSNLELPISTKKKMPEETVEKVLSWRRIR